MKITILGTGTSQGIPVIGSDHPVCKSTDSKDKRLRVSAMIEYKDKRLVIDCGPDFRQQMLRHDVSHLDGVLFTHEHADHTAGLDDLRPFFFRQGEINCHMTSRVHKALQERFSYMFATVNKYPGVADLTVHEFENDSFMASGIKIIPVLADHGFIPVHGFRIEDFAYMTDVKTISTSEKQKLKNLDVLVLNMLREQEHHTHLNLEEALELVRELQPQRTYFTHISHHLGFHEEVEKNLPEGVFLAYDNLEINL
ncbi:MBL fold metallo-hydrolase [Nonlabens ulvanivorans]|uniref:Beta-lactamase n=1 Tax=Nonlabens ulvanivorans TaxID=906888 RepID=A0A084K084_NONUL|nr:MBL fold metallo-hydrolase [Nonlabens ulvanivorans]KEZ94618.1 beta-lactamase [Nonlabens ulvanivorans]PRX12531.1 phosphoribosyl 1,2-cyclic phosphate phosphodiesterase [Nonlabens ulvanivorans]GAK77353.1 metal-dependent hydrolases of thebeta-lactamase superfamily I [Nonlabens ulvanivorans]GAL01527.1 metal-dependent hydrolases [Nonlabens ulvanivorans]GAL76372.1 metal-dependent hydrolases of the beta-lactamase superfamily I [Nonlabens ulvanivorans]